MHKFALKLSISFGALIISMGAVNDDKAVFISPDSEANIKIKGKAADEIEYMRFDYEDGKLTLDPILPPHWTWFAGKGFEAGGKEVQFVFWNGILFTNHTDLKYCNFRSRIHKDILYDVKANAFVICFRKTDEVILFTAVDKEQDVYIVIPQKYLGKEMKFSFHLKDNEAKFIRIGSTNPPYLP